jgi:uncharacterized protein YfeS
MKVGAAPIRYFDDDSYGPSPTTSHPRFVEICKDRFFYDGTDEFAPFGSDAGADTLDSLQQWYRDPGPRKVGAFVEEMLTGWGMTLPDLRETDEAVVFRWLADDELAIVLPEVNQLLIAAAFGQYKITGAVDADVRELAVAAATREVFATEHGRRTNPKWAHAEAKAVADGRIRAALDAMGQTPAPFA